jgi:precorrin-6Y C5,15-methyltransferase (decarboxylating)
VATVGSLDRVQTALQARAGEVEVLMVNLARGTDQLERLRFEAMNPSFLISALKRP